jgi:hypothetical protein
MVTGIICIGLLALLLAHALRGGSLITVRVTHEAPARGEPEPEAPAVPEDGREAPPDVAEMLQSMLFDIDGGTDER